MPVRAGSVTGPKRYVEPELGELAVGLCEEVPVHLERVQVSQPTTRVCPCRRTRSVR